MFFYNRVGKTKGGKGGCKTRGGIEGCKTRVGREGVRLGVIEGVRIEVA